jgi:hypothetical protein
MSEVTDTEVHAYKAAYSKFMQNEFKLLEKGLKTNADPSFEANRFALGAVKKWREKNAKV